MVKLTPIISDTAPSQKNVLWIKPVSGGFTLYIKDSGRWLAMKQMDDQGTSQLVDDTVQNLVGSVQDTKTANTINGAKAYAKDAADAVVGTSSDTSSDMTLNGLKAYVDEQIATLG